MSSDMRKRKHKNIGSDFEDFLAEEGLLDEAHEEAAKRVFAWALRARMKSQGLDESKLARKMGLSGRSTVRRLLDPKLPSATLATMVRAAEAVGAVLQVRLVPKAASRRRR